MRLFFNKLKDTFNQGIEKFRNFLQQMNTNGVKINVFTQMLQSAYEYFMKENKEFCKKLKDTYSQSIEKFRNFPQQMSTTGVKDENNNVFTQMLQSAYGYFMKCIHGLKGLDKVMKENQLSNIVVIGNTSAGKSSLLENIIKCPIFPRDRTKCTKFPIRIKMHCGSKFEITINEYNNVKAKTYNDTTKAYNHLSELMSKTPVSKDELVINVSDPSFIEITLCDTPGIIEYPQEDSDFTRDIILSYIQNKNNLIVCVVDADTPQLTSSQAMGLVINNKRMNDTIIALSKMDKVHNDDIEDKIIKRILRRSDTGEELNKFNECVAICNRSPKGTIQDVQKENDKMSKTVLETANSEGWKQYSGNIKDNIGINNFIKVIDKRFGKFIKDKWVPNSKNVIQEDINNTDKCLNNIGTDINKLDGEKLIEIYMRKLIENITNDKIDKNLKQSLDKRWNDAKSSVIGMPLMDTQEHKTFTDEMAKRMLIDNSHPLSIVKEAVLNSFPKELDSNDEYRIKRFDRLQTDAITIVQNQISKYFDKYYTIDVKELQDHTKNYLLPASIGNKAYSDLYNIYKYNIQNYKIESQEFANERKRLNDSKKSLLDSIEQLNHIGNSIA